MIQGVRCKKARRCYLMAQRRAESAYIYIYSVLVVCGGSVRSAVRVQARCACSGPTDSQPMASDTSTPSLLLTCVLQCESTCVAGEAHTRAACVTSVLCTRVVVCRAQRGERRRGGGEDEAVAKPSAHIKIIRKSGNQEIKKSRNQEWEVRKWEARCEQPQHDPRRVPRPGRARRPARTLSPSRPPSGKNTVAVAPAVRQGRRCDCNANEGNTPED